ncbi:ArsR family transcriptional regulator [Leptospira yasudae]|uniref:Transcriptional regulator n=1 Tax=Leptospira yasudae TaxID=2202201 RepID=A0ABX9M310_9LEPT|nr:transcriptional regulator [Leptospira yasudae]TGK27039.1 ArsR family transcriptional regulator [Leptospira yasudae]TGM08167.1 ArsR family transcriptional regulator [Leptospira yasudae]
MRKNQGIDPRVQEFLSALASETRLNLLLSFADGKEKTVGELVELSGLGQSTISTHLNQLKKGGILIRRKSGKEVYYKPDRERILEHISKLTSYLRGCC